MATAPGGPSTSSIHIADLDDSVTGDAKNWNATVTILVEDNLGTPVADATVTGSWSSGGSSSGTATAELHIMVDAAPPKPPSGLLVLLESVTKTQIGLSWVDNADNETGFKIERSKRTNGSFVEIATVGPNETSYLDTTVRKGTTYYYRVRATNAGVDSAYSNEVSARTRKK